MNIKDFVKLYRGHTPEMLYFDYLYSEYSALDPQTKNSAGQPLLDVKPRLDVIHNKRKDATLSWNDVYCFELILADFLPVERLRSKIMSLRYDYRSIAGQKEFDDYMAAKPPDLMSPPDPTDPPHATQQQYEKLLREDLKDLLGRLYLRYTVLPVKEARLKGLTTFAAGLCLIGLIALLIMVAILVNNSSNTSNQAREKVATTNTTPEKKSIAGQGGGNKYTDIASYTIFVVIFSGVMGGFVSALQRIQSPPSEGDSIYNLSLLFNGSYSVFVAPITGAIFAILVYLMFASGILQGSFFPEIYGPLNDLRETPPKLSLTTTPADSSGASENSNSSETSSNTSSEPASAGRTDTTEAKNTQPSNSNLSTSSSASMSSNSSAPSTGGLSGEYQGPPTKVKGPHEVKQSKDTKRAKQSLEIGDFLVESGPVSGKAYALLIIWSFIAGFAERFVPDALDRLIPGGQPQPGGKS